MTGYVYVIGSDEGPLKIGISRRPGARLMQLQGGHPYKLRIMKCWEHEAPAFIEAAAHQRLPGSSVPNGRKTRREQGWDRRLSAT